MFEKNIPDGASLFIGGAIAVFISWIASGCRMGSYVVQPPAKTNPDTISGYYVLQPQTLKLYATTDQTHQQKGAVSLIPQEISQFITNPVALILQDLTTGSAALASPTGKSALPIYVNADSTLTYHGMTSNVTFWQDPDCQNYLEISESGKIIKTSNVTGPPGNTLPLSGRLELTIQVINKFQGNCTPTFTLLSSCYQDASQCGGKDSQENDALQNSLMTLLDPWLESKAILAGDIANLVNYAYEVSYQ